MEPELPLAINLPRRGSRKILRSLHAQLRAAILDGRLRPGLRMPPTRSFGLAHGVSRNTATAAYDLLLGEGYLVTRERSGTFVAEVVRKASGREKRVPDPTGDSRLGVFWRAVPNTDDNASRDAPTYDFRLGVPERRSFPVEVWNRLSARALRTLSTASLAPPEPQGRLAARTAIAQHASYARAVACRPENIHVTTGAQQAFDLLARTLVTSGRTIVAMENPGYPPMRAAFSAAGAKIVAVPVDSEGMVVELLPRAARVICVTPSHQYPLGYVLSAHRRATLLDCARRQNAVIIEDDYDGEFRFGGRPLDALQTLDRAESVFYVGTFSKSLLPEIGLGYVVAPPWARRALVAAKQCGDRHTAELVQDTLALFIAEGHMARHVRKMRGVYASRRQVLLDGLRRDFGDRLEPIPSVAGLHIAAFSSSAADTRTIIESARRHQIGLRALRPYYWGDLNDSGDRARNGLLFGYGAIDADAIREGLLRLCQLLAR